MHKRALIRLSLGALVIGAGGSACFIAGCGDDTTDTTTPAVDGGLTDQASPPVDSGTPTDGNTTTDTGTDAGPPHAKVILVHASPGLGALRICFKLGKPGLAGTIVPPIPALPDVAKEGQPYPGIFPGTGGPFPDLLDLSPFEITPVVIKASSISADVRVDGGTERTCQDLLASDAGIASGDITTFPTLPAGTFAPNSTLLLALTGCAAGETGGVSPFTYTAQQKCGAAYTSANSNFAIQKFTLDTAPAGATQLGGQFINLAQGIENEIPPFAANCGTNAACQANGLWPVVMKNDPSGDAAAPPIVVPLTGGPAKFPELKPATAKGVDSVVPADTQFAFFGSNTAVGGDGGLGPRLSGAPLPFIQLFTTGSTSTTDGGAQGDYYKNGHNYTFILLGDPTAGAFGPTNGYGTHFLGFDNDPVLPPK
jgi:hypothetical protein